MKTIEGTSDNFDELIEANFTLVKFFAVWCGPCKMLAPLVAEVATEKDIDVVTVDIDNAVDIATRYGVMTVPTLMIFKKGELKAANAGFMPKETLSKWIDDNRN